MTVSARSTHLSDFDETFKACVANFGARAFGSLDGEVRQSKTKQRACISQQGECTAPKAQGVTGTDGCIAGDGVWQNRQL